MMNYSKIKTILVVVLLFFMLVAIRFFEQAFYDPFISYFKSDYHKMPLPEYQSIPLFLNLTARYVLNSVISIGLIWILFKEMDFVKMAGIFYVLSFLLLLFLLMYFLQNQEINDKLPIFYIRRFLIQPLFLLVLLPAFYYYQNTN